jgi:hypothetical protein
LVAQHFVLHWLLAGDAATSGSGEVTKTGEKTNDSNRPRIESLRPNRTELEVGAFTLPRFAHCIILNAYAEHALRARQALSFFRPR